MLFKRFIDKKILWQDLVDPAGWNEEQKYQFWQYYPGMPLQYVFWNTLIQGPLRGLSASAIEVCFLVLGELTCQREPGMKKLWVPLGFSSTKTNSNYH